ncbi:5888_t:CDS:2 [Paraglomus occultum]|uniref:5888_t:CDS:1 n=1 Tax=Paraglomus occultum TaxID=144539 RepID=A0A9N9F1J4_9GLOM|nr:5888_t:CDS:2 [Paraglomus occultum]
MPWCITEDQAPQSEAATLITSNIGYRDHSFTVGSTHPKLRPVTSEELAASGFKQDALLKTCNAKVSTAHFSRGICGSEICQRKTDTHGTLLNGKKMVGYMLKQRQADGRVLSQFQGLSNGRRRMMSKIIEPNSKLCVIADKSPSISGCRNNPTTVICCKLFSTGSSSVSIRKFPLIRCHNAKLHYGSTKAVTHSTCFEKN